MRLFGLTTCVLVLAAATSVSATPLTLYTFTGTVTSVDIYGFPPGMLAGDAVTASLTYDSDVGPSTNTRLLVTTGAFQVEGLGSLGSLTTSSEWVAMIMHILSPSPSMYGDYMYLRLATDAAGTVESATFGFRGAGAYVINDVLTWRNPGLTAELVPESSAIVTEPSTLGLMACAAMAFVGARRHGILRRRRNASTLIPNSARA